MRYKLYLPNNAGLIHGLWLDNGKLYKDKLSCQRFSTLKASLAYCKDYLSKYNEICLALEDKQKNILRLVYRDKIELLKHKEVFKTTSNIIARQKIKYCLAKNNGVTYYKHYEYFIIFTYGA